MPTFYFYKGTCMPMMWLEEEDTMRVAKEQLALGLRMSNCSLNEQADDYINQLNIVEELMFEYCNPTSEAGLNKVCEILGRDINHIYSMWCINICCLLILKKLNNDDKNGIMTLK